MRFFAASALCLGLAADRATYTLAKGDSKGDKGGKNKACKDVKIQIVETFDSLTSICITDRELGAGGCAGGPRLAGDYDTWDDETYLMGPVMDALPDVPESCAVTGQLVSKLGTHRGRCMWVGAEANHCEGSMTIDHPDYGTGDISIMGQAPIPIGDFAPTNPDIRFTISGGTGDFEGAYGSVTPGIQYGFDPDFMVSGKTPTPYPGFIPDVEMGPLGFPDFATCPFAAYGYPPFLPLVDPTFQAPVYNFVPEVFMVIVYEAQFSCNKAIK